MRGTSGGRSSFEARFRSRLRMTGETVVRVNVTEEWPQAASRRTVADRDRAMETHAFCVLLTMRCANCLIHFRALAW